jgi:hypothetical protein
VAFLDSAGSSYIYLYMKNAQRYGKLRIITQSALNLSGIIKATKRKYNPVIKELGSYATESIKFEKYLEQVMSKTSFGDESMTDYGVKNISPGVKGEESLVRGLASQVLSIQKDARKLKNVINYYNEVLCNIETIDTNIINNIATLALENEYVKEALSVVIPDGIYSQSNAPTEKIIQSQIRIFKNSIQKLQGYLSENGESIIGGGSEINMTALAAEHSIRIIRGVLYEAEFLNAALQAIVEGNQEFAIAPTGSISKNFEADPRLKEDIAEANSSIAKLSEAINSITTSTPKVDLVASSVGEGGATAVFGLSLKTISDNKYKRGIENLSASKQYAVDLGTVAGKSLGEIMRRYKKSLAQAVDGQDVLWYSKQILAGLPGTDTRRENPDEIVKGEGSSYAQYTKAWNLVANMCSTLTLVDSLVGTSQGLGAGYFVVNNQVYRSAEILDGVIKNMAAGHISGVFGESGINKKVGLAVQRARYIKGPINSMSLAVQRSGKVNTELDAVFNTTVLKTKISLGALIKYSGLSAI